MKEDERQVNTTTQSIFALAVQHLLQYHPGGAAKYSHQAALLLRVTVTSHMMVLPSGSCNEHFFGAWEGIV